MIDLNGEVDVYHVPEIKERLLARVDAGDTDLILNLSGVDFIDSIGLGMLVTLHKKIMSVGGSLRVLCANRQIGRVFDITGLTRAFPVYRDELTLVASLDAK